MTPLPSSWFKPPDAPLQAPWPLVMGIVNVTPDSFSDGGRYDAPEQALQHASKLAQDGADILDIGGESTRSGAAAVSAADEIARTVPVIRALRERGVQLPISIDTSKAAVAEAALAAGANIVNDVTAGEGDPAMLPLCARAGCVVVLMHMRGTPRTMQQQTHYGDVVAEVRDYLASRLAAAVAAGCARRALMIDPGFGFGKLPEHNCRLVRELPVLAALQVPVLLGVSRKSTLGQLTGRPVEDREPESLAAALVGALKGAAVLRAHEPGPLKRAVAVLRAMF
ncbi:MAG: dihydropteroate synthase [Planctomycetes bacterium]|nr:dihydropteroate synthase [Planctomycetota bacterium]